jgi:hypothetical protein
MQAILCCDDLMADKLTDILRGRIDKHETDTAEHFSKITNRLHDIDKTLIQINASLKPHPKPWWITAVIAPLIVAAIVASVGDIIYLHICIKGLQGYAHDSGGYIAGLKLQQNGNNPTDPKDVAAVKQVLESAKSNKLKIDPNIVNTVGKKFVESGVSNADVWDTAMALVAYRSDLNVLPPFVGPPKPWPDQLTEAYDTSNIRNPNFQMYSVGIGKPEDRAEFRKISAPDENKNHSRPNAFLVIKNADVVLDGLRARNVVFQKSHIIYSGGSVSLYNVTFIDCTFEVIRKPIGQEFAENVLYSPATFNLNAPFVSS